LKLARLILLQFLLITMAIGWVANPESPPYLPSPLVFGQSIPAAGRLYVSPMPPESLATPAPVMPTLQPPQDRSTIVTPHSPGLSRFMERVVAGEPEHVVGLYATDTFDLLVEQQPPDHHLYVTEKLGYATQFGRPLRYDVIGLLAHNTNSGILFYGLDLGDDVYLVFGDGRLAVYRVETIEDFQKLEPGNPRSDYVELSSGEILNTNEVFTRFYRNGPHLTLQTCLEMGGDFNWGVRFIVAKEIEQRIENIVGGREHSAIDMTP
jgi:hypothetical protein